MTTIFLFLIIFLFFILAEYLYREKKITVEKSRKMVHMVSGSIISIFPYYVSFEIAIFSGIFLSLLLLFFKKKK